MSKAAGIPRPSSWGEQTRCIAAATGARLALSLEASPSVRDGGSDERVTQGTGEARCATFMKGATKMLSPSPKLNCEGGSKKAERPRIPRLGKNYWPRAQHSLSSTKTTRYRSFCFYWAVRAGEESE